MTTNFCFSFPQLNNVYNITSNNENSNFKLFGHENLLNGQRFTRYRTSTSSTSHKLVFDFGKQKLSADHIILARADVLERLTGQTIKIYGSSDDVIYQDIDTINIQSTNFVGKDSQDLIHYLDNTYEYRFWKFVFASGLANYHTFSKLYFSELFDFGIEPDTFMTELEQEETFFVSDDETTNIYQSNDNRTLYKIGFKGVSDAKLASFKTIVDKYMSAYDSFCGFLVTKSSHDLLDSKQIVHVKFETYRDTKIYYDYNSLYLECRELIG